MATVRLAPNSSVPGPLSTKDVPAFTAGEANIYFTLDGKHAVKIYRNTGRARRESLSRLVSLNRDLGEADRLFAWPLAIVDAWNGTPATGVVMRRIPDGYKQLYLLMSTHSAAIREFQKGRSWLEYLKMARGTAMAVAALNDMGVGHSDISFRNFLANPETGEVVLIDLDGAVVRGHTVSAVAGTPMFLAPEVLQGRARTDERTDRHATAVLILWTLLFRNVLQPMTCYDANDDVASERVAWGEMARFSEDPGDKRNSSARTGGPLFRGGQLSYRCLSPALQDLSVRSMVAGLHDPARRPKIGEWEQALANAYDLVVPCFVPECRQSYLYQFWAPATDHRCPFCGGPPRLAAVVCDLLPEQPGGGAGVVRPLVIHHNHMLFEDVALPRVAPPFSRKGTPVLGSTVWDATAGRYRLLNRSRHTWSLVGKSGKVDPGATILLEVGTVLSLGLGRRIIRVLSAP